MCPNGQDPFVHIETGRYKTVTDQETGRIRSMKVGERVCLICKSNIVEDEKHFLFSLSNVYN